jgi:tetratricopeptide (TPR) repeat protein
MAAAPNEANVHSQYASFLGIVGRFDESVRESRAALALDPQSPAAMQSFATMLLGARLYDSALVMARRSITLEPNNQITWNARWEAAWYSNRFDEAFESIAGLQNAAGINAVDVSELKQAFANGGKPAVVRLLLAKWPQNYRPAYRALWHAELGDRDRAMERLERGYDEKWISLPYVLRWQSFDGMKSDPRFVAFMKKMGLEPSAAR